jgi:nudix-type nucleoside diphosphatase (YffH/AdpP family)
MVRPAQIIGQTLVYERWSRISDVVLQMPNGAREARVVEDHGCAAAVLLYDPARRMALLLRQPRAPVMLAHAADLLEVVAGRIEGHSSAATARTEALEEAGVRIRELEHVATLWTMPAVSTERLALYLAAYCPADRITAGGGAADENECITLEEIALCELRAMMVRQELTDGKTFTLVQALLLRRPELFT